ncbi:MAG: 50S ribosomal protein L21 [Candidatus Azambacteria bacterium]|nr:50S ribosomal protein L21 [Candidatus Azambacteria bacterium]
MTYAVIKTGGKQYLVKEGDKIRIEKIDAKEGEEVKFDKVLLISGNNIKIGTPLLEGAEVYAKVLKNGRAKKIIIFHYHSKTRYKKKGGHRQMFSEVEIKEIK